MTTQNDKKGVARICWRCPMCGWERFGHEREYTAVYCRSADHDQADSPPMCQPYAYIPYGELTQAKNRVLRLRKAITSFIEYARNSGTWGRDPDLSLLKDALLKDEEKP